MPFKSRLNLLSRHLGALFYDGFILFAVLIVAAMPLPLLETITPIDKHHWLKIVENVYITIVAFGFFYYFWKRGQPTLGMRAWRLCIRFNCEKMPFRALKISEALMRSIFGLLGLLCAGLGIFWRLIDKNGRSWADLASSTETIMVPKQTKQAKRSKKPANAPGSSAK